MRDALDSFLTVEEICSLLKVERHTVARWISSGQLPAFKPGGGRFWRVRRQDFQKFIKGGVGFRDRAKRRRP
ncbi:MAG: helix-turn-helix domain-containing protein [Acidobacteria bacterium]|nr:helix-turn-helix domain-containing protein [Acidobacteriota bacterium]